MQSNAIEHALERHITEYVSRLEIIPSCIWTLRYSWRGTFILNMQTGPYFPALSLRQRGGAAQVSTPLPASCKGKEPFQTPQPV